jgi:UDP-glucose 4-epimerase
MTTWLLTGGAGYIGAHVLRALRAAGLDVVVLDDLSTGRAERVPPGVPLIEASVLDRRAVELVLREYGVAGVVHLAGKKAVEESVREPLRYYRENGDGVLALLQAMDGAGVRRLVFSSSAAVYGAPASSPVLEDDPTVPLSPYGRSKLLGEWMVADAAGTAAIGAVSLRYFNVVGCAEPALADTGTSNLFPRVLDALAREEPPVVFGTDYPTPDGSCVRDYIHVADLARAHVAATALTAPGAHHALNVGCGRGYTVLEVLAMFAEVTGRDTTPRPLGRRAGDPPAMVADPGRARALLGWDAHHGLREMVTSTWEAASNGTGRHGTASRPPEPLAERLAQQVGAQAPGDR